LGSTPFSSAPQVQSRLAVNAIDALVAEGKAFETHSAKTLPEACSWRLVQNRIDSINDNFQKQPVSLCPSVGNIRDKFHQRILWYSYLVTLWAYVNSEHGEIRPFFSEHFLGK
tara:strand:+ start:63 stop:401 length:339 start_codon:yes stop_codon:yes gene_type:complete